MIKFLHSSDWHLGKSLFAKSLLEDQDLALQELRALIEAERPDAVLLAGDLFDRSIPPEAAVKRLDLFLADTVLKLKTPVVLIPGNHDSNIRLGLHADLLRGAGLHVFSSPESILQPARFKTASVYGIPYLEPAEWALYFERQNQIRTHQEALEAIIEALKPLLADDRAQGRRSVLVLHAYVTGGEPSESERPLSIGGSDLVHSELLRDFDYVALGHLHRPQTIGSERIRYSGSLFPYSQSEASQEKGVVRVTLDRPETDRFDFLPFQTCRKLRSVRGKFEDLLKSEPSDDYVIAMLTDAVMPFEAYRSLQRVFPSLLHVGREIDWSRSDAEEADQAARVRRKLEASDQEVLGEFLISAASDTITDEDREWLLAELDAFSKADAT
ncbi:MAG: exonuclease SbcCD subunit D [Bdellovibrionales bacterium]|nr:exonuclease SbcCD subunit D [Bdellovibrionales bacterium]